ncbi:MAG: glycosyltransferase family 2 protein [Bacteroidota bacterium]
MILIFFHTVTLCVIGGFLLHLFLLSVLAAFARTRTVHPAGRLRKIAVVIPAHNEELTIAETVRNVRDIYYPPEFFQVIVVADNCDDATGEIALREGAQVLTRTTTGERSKGHALRWCFDRLQGTDCEAVAVVDADTVVSPNFLSVLNMYFASGSEVIQCNDQVRPHHGAWSPEAIRLGFALNNYVRPLGRKTIGCSAGLRGNGMAFSMGVLRRIPWESYSQAEDLEHSLRLALRGVRVAFAPEATVLATMTQDPRLAESQRTRWEMGRFPLMRKYAVKLLIASFRHHSLVMADTLIDLLTPALVNLVGLALLLGIVALVQFLAGDSSMLIFAELWGGAVVLGVLHGVIGLLVAGSARSLISLLWLAPRYAVWKIALYLKIARGGRSRAWVRTAREPGGIR